MSIPCRIDSESVAEPLAASAPERVAAWLLVEHGGPWGSELPTDATSLAAHDREVLSALQARVPGIKVVFTRRAGLGPLTAAVCLIRPDGPSSAPALPAGLQGWPRRAGWRVEGGASLTEILGALTAGPGSSAAVQVASTQDEGVCPRWLLCTHGTRDACCAKWGRALLPELERAGVAHRESSHLGGHRFAPVVLDLETGILLGRLEAGELAEAVDAASAGRLPSLRRWRGRTTLSRFEQAAELLVRELGRLDLPGSIASVRTVHALGAGPDSSAIVHVEVEGGDMVVVHARWSEPRMSFGSCGDEQRTPFRSVLARVAS